MRCTCAGVVWQGCEKCDTRWGVYSRFLLSGGGVEGLQKFVRKLEERVGVTRRRSLEPRSGRGVVGSPGRMPASGARARPPRHGAFFLPGLYMISSILSSQKAAKKCAKASTGPYISGRAPTCAILAGAAREALAPWAELGA